jgi:hypothetical protein
MVTATLLTDRFGQALRMPHSWRPSAQSFTALLHKIIALMHLPKLSRDLNPFSLWPRVSINKGYVLLFSPPPRLEYPVTSFSGRLKQHRAAAIGQWRWHLRFRPRPKKM